MDYNIHNGIKDVKPRIDINEYPAVKAHLDLYWDKISKAIRETHHTILEMRLFGGF